MSIRSTTGRTRTGAAVGVLVATLALTGCGSSSTSSSQTPPGSTASEAPSGRPSPSAESFAAYQQCLSEHGVTMTERPHPSPGAPRPSQDSAAAAQFREARQACASLRPIGGLRPNGIHNGARHQFRECMRQHGVDLPKPMDGTPPPGDGPTPEATSGRGGMLAGLDLNDPKTHAALEACRSILINNASTSAPEASAAPTS